MTTTWPHSRIFTQTKTSTRVQKTKPCWRTSTKLFKASKCNHAAKGDVCSPSRGKRHVWPCWSGAVTSYIVLHIPNDSHSKLKRCYYAYKGKPQDDFSLWFCSSWALLWGETNSKIVFEDIHILYVFIWADIVSCNVSSCSCMHIFSVYFWTVSWW